MSNLEEQQERPYAQYQLLTVPETAELLNKSEAQLRWMIHQDTAPQSALLGGRRMFRLADVEAFVDAAFDDASAGRTPARSTTSTQPVGNERRESESEPVDGALSNAPDLMSPETLSRVLDGVAVATLAEWRTGQNLKTRRGPAFHKLGGMVRYLKADVIAWLRENRVSTSEQA